MRPYSTLLPGLLKEDRYSVKATFLVLGATLLLPMLVHLLPAAGSVPVGARLLPLFYAPFVAILFYRVHVGLLAGILAPIINHVLFGKPAAAIVAILSTELAIFTIIAFLLVQIRPARWIAAPLAYLLTKVVSMLLLMAIPSWLPGQSPADFALTSVTNAWPGLVALLLLNIAAGWNVLRTSK